MTFGLKLAFCRRQRKLSQQQLGKLAEVSGDIVGKYERDEMKPSIETAKRLAEALGVTLDYLVGDGEMEPMLDKQMIERLAQIEKMPEEVRERVLFFIDLAIRDYKAKGVYAVV